MYTHTHTYEEKNDDLFSGLTKDEKHTQTPPSDDFYEKAKILHTDSFRVQQH